MLRLVGERPGVTVRGFATQLDVDATGLYGVVRRLQGKGRCTKDGTELRLPTRRGCRASRRRRPMPRPDRTRVPPRTRTRVPVSRPPGSPDAASRSAGAHLWEHAAPRSRAINQGSLPQPGTVGGSRRRSRRGGRWPGLRSASVRELVCSLVRRRGRFHAACRGCRPDRPGGVGPLRRPRHNSSSAQAVLLDGVGGLGRVARRAASAARSGCAWRAARWSWRRKRGRPAGRRDRGHDRLGGLGQPPERGDHERDLDAGRGRSSACTLIHVRFQTATCSRGRRP